MLKASEIFQIEQHQDDPDFRIVHIVRLIQIFIILVINYIFWQNPCKKHLLYNKIS